MSIPENKLDNDRVSKKKTQLVVCVSGGSDSVALLHLFRQLSGLLRLQLHILHFNHRLRPEAAEEQNFVKSLATQYKIPFHLETANQLKPGQLGLQESARKWRITESQKLLKMIGEGSIATGHHADDQTETLLLKWLRGAHISNLQGMSWKSPPFVRPLLNCSKIELQEYLKSNQLTWMEDKSNQSPDYLRNRVRLELIPLLDELTRQGLQARISNLNDQSLLLREQLDSEYADWQKSFRKSSTASSAVLYLADLSQENELLQQEIMHNFITVETGLTLNYNKLQSIFDLLKTADKTWKIQLSHNWIICKSAHELVLKISSEKENP